MPMLVGVVHWLCPFVSVDMALLQPIIHFPLVRYVLHMDWPNVKRLEWSCVSVSIHTKAALLVGNGTLTLKGLGLTLNATHQHMPLPLSASKVQKE